jgi:tetratricopeptide (TPR) repeat protein
MIKSFLKKCAFGILTFFLLLIVFELVLRILGTGFTVIQEYKNILSKCSKADVRILCLGESTTAGAGWGSYPSLLRECIDRDSACKKIQIINKGVVGTTTGRIALRIEEYIKEYHPDIIMTMMGINDLQVQPDERVSIKFPWYNHLRLVQFASAIYHLSQAVVWKLFPDLFDKTKPRCSEAYSLANVQDMPPKEIIKYVQYMDSVEDHRLALQILKIAAKSFPDNADIIAYLGAVQRWVGQRQESRINLLKALDINPGHVQALHELSNLYNNMGLSDESFALRKKMIEVAEYAESGYLLLAEVYMRDGDYESAEEVFLRGLQRLPGNDRLLGALGTLYLARNNREQAEEYFSRARDIRMKLPKPYTTKNYQFIEQVASKHNIPLVVLQYPLRSVDEMKELLRNPENVIFVSNEKVFKDAVMQRGYFTYFIDMFGGEFGHCTAIGNKLLAENVKESIKDLIQ